MWDGVETHQLFFNADQVSIEMCSRLRTHNARHTKTAGGRSIDMYHIKYRFLVHVYLTKIYSGMRALDKCINWNTMKAILLTEMLRHKQSYAEHDKVEIASGALPRLNKKF